MMEKRERKKIKLYKIGEERIDRSHPHPLPLPPFRNKKKPLDVDLGSHGICNLANIYQDL